MDLKNKPALLGGKKAITKPFKAHPVLGAEEKKEVLSVLKSGELSGFVAKAGEVFYGGKQVRRFEQAVSKAWGCKYVVGMNSATSALHAALYAVGVGPGDEVIVTPYTMSASASAILMCGAIPVFCDIEKETYGLDPEKIEAKITKQTKAVLAVHLFGHPARIKEITVICKKHDLRLIEDCAQSPAATLDGKYVGTFGDIGVFSLNQHKTITTGEGGFAITQSDEYALRMSLVRNHGEVVHDHIPEAKNMLMLGWNYRFTELEASVAIAQFAKLEMLTKHRIKLAQRLIKKLSSFKALSLPVTRKGARHVYFVFPMKINTALLGLSRAEFAKALIAEGVGVGEGYVRPIYREPIYQKKSIYQGSSFPFDQMSSENSQNYKNGSCPVTENFHDKELLVTGLCRYPLSIQDMDNIAAAFAKVIQNAKALRSYFDNNPSR